MTLDILIVGGGIAGLSAAISLRRAGHHRVRILERSSLATSNEVGAAINVCPNASRALLAWGLDPVVHRFVEVKGITTGVGATLETVVSTAFGPWVRGVYGAPYFFAHRVDLHEALKDLAIGTSGAGKPAILQLNTTVVSYDPEIPSVTLSTGDVLTADLIIAADGIHSLAVETVLGHSNPSQPQELYNGCFRFLIPAADLDSDPETSWWNRDAVREGRMSIYMNGKTGNRCVSYPCRDHELWNFVCMFHDDSLASGTKEDWHAPVDTSHVLKAFADFHPSLRAVLKKATDVKRWPLLYRAPIPTWTRGKLVMIGDAAHPMLPHQGQGGAQAIEDGIALGIALSGVSVSVISSCPSEIPQRLAIFEKARRDRASAIQILSNVGQEQIELIHKEVEKYVGFVPKTPQEFSHFNWGHDIVRSTEDLLRKEIDPDFELPAGFFEGGNSPYMPRPQPSAESTE